jgi:Na+-driven multidrug efflux pump
MTLLRVTLLASIPDAITNVYVSVLRVRGRLPVAAGLNLVMGLGIVGLSWLLLPALGVSAVGWAFLAAQTGGCAFVAMGLRSHSTQGGVPSKPYASN